MQKIIYFLSFAMNVSLLFICLYLLFIYINPNKVDSSRNITELPSIAPTIISPVGKSRVPKKVLGVVSINSPTPKVYIVSKDIKKTYIMNAINDYRSSRGLAEVVTNDLTCNFAKTRAFEITSNFSHDGFKNRLNNHSLPYSNYSFVTENIAETSDYTKVVDLWANSPGHAANMRADTPYVCVEYNGNFYAYEGWKPL